MAFGMIDIAMNAQGSTVERAYGRPADERHARRLVRRRDLRRALLGSLSIALGLSFTANVALIAPGVAAR